MTASSTPPAQHGCNTPQSAQVLLQF
jgi:hypothetical protein